MSDVLIDRGVPESRQPVAVVTGAATGIGAAVTRALLSAGWHVVATRLPGQPTESGVEGASFVEADLTSPEAPSLVADCSAQQGDAALFVSSAGVSLPGPIELRADDLLTEFAVNAAAPARLVAALLPQLRKRRGNIVLIGAGQGRVSLPFGGGYGASKAGLIAIADALRAEVADAHVRVSVIEPGAVRTRILEASTRQAEDLLAQAPAELRERYGRRLEHTLHVAAGAFDKALPPQRIADLVLRIATARNPKPRYLIGPEARVLALVAHLPPRWRASAIRRMLADT